MKKLISLSIMLLMLTFFCVEHKVKAHLSDELSTLHQSLNELKVKTQQLSKNLIYLKEELEDLKPQRTFDQIVSKNHDLILEEPYEYNNFTIYDIKVLPQRFKRTLKDHVSTSLWLHTIDPQFAREGWSCGFHSIKNALYLAKLLTFPPDTYKQNEDKLIAKFQEPTHFLKYLEWPKSLKQQPLVEIPLDTAKLGREAVFKHLAQTQPWNMPTSIPWGLSWLKERVTQQYPESPRTPMDSEMQYQPRPKPALYSIIYNPLALSQDVINLTQSMRLGNAVATKFMKRCLQSTIIIHKFYPANRLNQKFLPTDLGALKQLSEKFNTMNSLLVPILWSYETSLGNHWVTLVVSKKENVKEILLADADIHGTSHYWITQNKAVVEELAEILSNKNYFHD